MKRCTKRGKRGTAAHRKRGRGDLREDLLTEEGEEVAGGWRPPVAGDRRNTARSREEAPGDRELAGAGRGKRRLLARSGWGLFFKTRDGHTGQSTVPVRCTPDSAQ